MRHPGRRGFTVLEMVITTALMAVILAAAWTSYYSGTSQTVSAGEHLSATQSALVLMESLQEDVRQLTIYNDVLAQLVPFSVVFSENGKSIMFRKSTLHNTDGELTGSSFSVVCYQMVEHPTYEGLFTIQRVERTTDGLDIPGKNRDFDEKVFRSLLLKDVRFDLIVKLEGDMSSYRTFIRTSITAAGGPPGKKLAGSDRVYLMTNMFEAKKPEYVHQEPGAADGFARRFIVSTKFDLIGTSGVKPPRGYQAPLPPPPSKGWPEYTPTFHDYVARDGTHKSFDTGAPTASNDPFEGVDDSPPSYGLPPMRTEYIRSATEFIRNQVGEAFQGRVLGDIRSRQSNPDGTPVWQEGFTLDASPTATEPIWKQLDEFLGQKIFPRGAEAVEDMGHALNATCFPNGQVIPTPSPPESPIRWMISPSDAQRLLSGG